MKCSRSSGFTIVELLIVLVIVGILATLVVTTFKGIQERKEGRSCDYYQNHKVEDLPAKCLDYFNAKRGY